MSGGKGGTETQKTTIPEYINHYAQKNLQRAAEVAQLGYQPYYGPDVAALTPMQLAAMDNNRAAASAFGMAAPTVNTLMDAPTEYAGGVRGYSSGPIFDQALAEYIARHPEQAARYNALFGNTVAPYVAPIAPAATVAQRQNMDSDDPFFDGERMSYQVVDPMNVMQENFGTSANETWGSHPDDGWTEYSKEFK